MSSVKVAVRVRPFNRREILMNSECVISMSGQSTSKCDHYMTEMLYSEFKKIYQLNY